MLTFQSQLLLAALAFSVPFWAVSGSAQSNTNVQLQGAASDRIAVTILGSGGGPPVDLEQYGPSILIEVGGERLLFDCGRGATLRLAQAGVPIAAITRLFLTHLHSDHVIQIPDLFLAGWVGSAGRKIPLEVWRPVGTQDMMANLERAFAVDIHVRRDVDEKWPAEGISVHTHEVSQGVVFDEEGVKVTAFLVDHEPIAPAFGYRVDYRGHSVAMSGDTRASENLVQFASGVDVLIHEAIDPVSARANSRNRDATERVIAHHTTAEQAGQIFSKVKPRLAVYSHVGRTNGLVEQTRKNYSGPLEGPEDLLRVEVGSQIEVTRLLAR